MQPANTMVIILGNLLYSDIDLRTSRSVPIASNEKRATPMTKGKFLNRATGISL